MGKYDKVQELKKKGYYVTVDKETGAATLPDGTPAPYNANNFDDDPEKVAAYDSTQALISAMQKMGEVESVGGATGSFADFLKKYGNENARAYSEAVRVANDSFYRSMMNYGKNAEMLAGNGLTSSGVSDYGNAAAYAARQGAVTEAGKARLQADTDAMAHYTGQIALANAEAQREARKLANTKVNTFLSAMEQTNLDETSARMLATQAGIYDEDEINMFVDAAKKLGEQRRLETDTAQAKIDAENEAAQKETRFMNTLTAFESLIASGKTAEEAKEYLSFVAPQYSQYDPDAIENIYNNHISLKELKKQTPTGEDPLSTVPEETITEAQALYNQYIEGGQTPAAAELAVESKYGKDVAEYLTKEINDLGDPTVISGVNTMLNDNYSPFGENQYTVKSINNSINNKEISESEGKAQIERIQQANLEWVSEVFDMAIDTHNIDRALAELEVSGEGLDAESKLATAYNALNERVKSLVVAGEMSEEKAAEYYKKYFNAQIDETSNIEEILNSIVVLKDKVGYIGEKSDDIYQSALEMAVDTIALDYKQVYYDSPSFDFMTKGKRYTMNLISGTKKDFEGKTPIGTFEVGRLNITVYDKGLYTIEGTSQGQKKVRYIKDVDSTGSDTGFFLKKVTKSDTEAVGMVAEDLLFAWMLKQCSN